MLTCSELGRAGGCVVILFWFLSFVFQSKAAYSAAPLCAIASAQSNMARKKRPLEFKVGTGQVIQGWDDALLTMSVGEEATLQVRWIVLTAAFFVVS